MPLLDVAAAAQRLLALVVDTAHDEDVTLPGRRYITDGQAGQEAWDCPQVTVGLVQLDASTAALGQEQVTQARVPRGTAMPPAAQLRVEIVRDSPGMEDDGTPPSAEQVHAAGIAALTDAALLHRVRARLITDSTLLAGAPGEVRTGPVIPAGPEGGMAAVAMTVAVTLFTTRPAS